MNALSLYLQTLFVPLAKAIGADIKSLYNKSSLLSVNSATRLIQTQRIIADQVLRGNLP